MLDTLHLYDRIFKRIDNSRNCQTFVKNPRQSLSAINFKFNPVQVFFSEGVLAKFRRPSFLALRGRMS